MKKWTDGFLSAWAMEHRPGTAFAKIGRLCGYYDRKKADEDRLFISCGTSWDDVARRLKAAFPTPAAWDHPKVVLSEDFWDCECEMNYIHPNSELFCQTCDVEKVNQPPARMNEVELMFPTSEIGAA